MVDRNEIARRHGLPPEHAPKLVGETVAELEADAAARAALLQALGPFDMNRSVHPHPAPAEREIEGMPSRDKPIADYTPEEWAAVHAHYERALGEQAKRKERERRETARA
jgi:hypothetical protein